MVNQRKDGSRYFEEETITPVRDADGEITHFVGIKQDISERKGLENQFLRAQRLEAVGKLAAGVAHDLNNILAPIMMAAPLLRDSPTAGDFNQSLDLIESSALRGAGVVRQLLTFSRGREGERIVMHLKHLVRDLGLIIRETFPRSIRFEPSLAPDLWPLFVDPTQLHQVLLNLCINARDAMPEGGVLRLTASNLMVDEQYAGLLPGLESGPYLQIEVSDNGQGIAPEDQERIFDLFFSTKEPGAGSGLGLATVQRVVTDHGGVVKVRSQLGQGTSFQLYLPARPAEVAIVEAQLLTLGPVGQGELILVVDDEDSIIQITQEMLRRHGYRTLTAADGTEAVACLAQHPIEIKAVITDLLMPEMDGFRLVQVLKHMAPDLPVLVSSGLEETREHEARVERLRELGVTCFLTKPYSAIQCLTALRAALTVPGRPEAQTTPKR
ncbi:MAG: response regulator [Verrucomicrobia bacterium]|nr:response regulator [Verrucomicrobiota bacterium]